VVEQVAKEMAGKVKIVGADVGESGDTASSFGISAIPALLFFKNGKEVHRIVGGIKKETLIAEIKKNLGV
jgi:thioredoxin-like negative regulator of GroEL